MKCKCIQADERKKNQFYQTRIFPLLCILSQETGNEKLAAPAEQ